jgi:hypothetical protein
VASSIRSKISFHLISSTTSFSCSKSRETARLNTMSPSFSAVLISTQAARIIGAFFLSRRA